MIGLMRVKNEERWIDRAIGSLLRFCARIIVMDDHSTDATPDIAEHLGATVIRSPFDDMDEARDKTWLVAQCYERRYLSPGDIAVMIDGDEELLPSAADHIRDALTYSDAASIKILYLWDDDQHIRVDGIYGRFWRPSAWRANGADRDVFISIGAANKGLHCSNVPFAVSSRAVRTHAEALHYGYMLRTDRVRKYQFYNDIDPGNLLEDQYRHVVIGDLFPAASRFMHAGPLEVIAWNGRSA